MELETTPLLLLLLLLCSVSNATAADRLNR
jgi:hypothetical protein